MKQACGAAWVCCMGHRAVYGLNTGGASQARTTVCIHKHVHASHEQQTHAHSQIAEESALGHKGKSSGGLPEGPGQCWSSTEDLCPRHQGLCVQGVGLQSGLKLVLYHALLKPQFFTERGQMFNF